MSHVITQRCVATCDTVCVDVCPVDCIAGPIPIAELRSVSPYERPARFPGLQLFIDPDGCTDCGACADACPATAIYPDDAVPAEHHGDIARNAQFFRR